MPYIVDRFLAVDWLMMNTSVTGKRTAWMTPITHSTIQSPQPSETSLRAKIIRPPRIPVTMMTLVLPIRSEIQPPTGPAHNPEEKIMDRDIAETLLEAPNTSLI